MCAMCVLSCVWPFMTPWTIACQAPLSMGFSRQEYWSGLLFPSLEDPPPPPPEMEYASLVSSALEGESLSLCHLETFFLFLKDPNCVEESLENNLQFSYSFPFWLFFISVIVYPAVYYNQLKYFYLFILLNPIHFSQIRAFSEEQHLILWFQSFSSILSHLSFYVYDIIFIS